MAEAEGGSPLWGVAAEFDTARAMVAALERLRDRGLGRVDAYSPMPVPGAAEALRLREQPIYPFAVSAALAGATVMFGLCTYGSIWGYRLDVGGRPLFSWPAFVVPSLSFGAMTGTAVVFGIMLLFNRMPRLNHPAFNIPDFTRATSDRYFVAVEAQEDAPFDADAVELAIAGLPDQPRSVRRVPR